MLDFFRRSSSGLKDEILSGLTVALALVPEAVAFALIAGVAPLVGLYAACTVGLITALFGGRPGMISGAAGALAVVVVSLVRDHGVQYLFPAVVLMGLTKLRDRYPVVLIPGQGLGGRLEFPREEIADRGVLQSQEIA